MCSVCVVCGAYLMLCGLYTHMWFVCGVGCGMYVQSACDMCSLCVGVYVICLWSVCVWCLRGVCKSCACDVCEVCVCVVV